MLGSHRVGGALFAGFAVYALCDLHGLNFDGRYADRLMDGYRPAHANRNAVRFESENLTKGAHIQPRCTGLSGIILPRFLLADGFCCALAQGIVAIRGSVLGLYKDIVPKILHSVADFALDANIRHLAESVIVGSGAVSVQGIAVCVCHGHRYEYDKINLILQSRHIPFPPFQYFPDRSTFCKARSAAGNSP